MRALPVHLLLSWSLASALALGGAGCLEAGPGARGGDTTVSTDTTSGTDTVTDLCAGKSCSDGDPCTIDSCDPATGACLHASVDKQAAPEPPECADDTGCDDGDACTEDHCIFVGPGECGGSGWAYCDHQPLVGCGGCMVAGCDDGNPCTLDVCQGDGSCRHDALEGCASGCNSINAIPAQEAEWTGWPGDAAKVAGVATGYPAQAQCYAGRPEGGASEAPCEVCAYPLGLGATLGEPANVRMIPPPEISAAWVCTEGCMASCTPMIRGAAYWAWGTGASSAYGASGGRQTPGDGAGMARPPMDGLEVVDFCLQTNAAGLVGSYRGGLSFEGLELPIPMEAEIHPTEAGGLAISLWPEDCQRPDCVGWIHEVFGVQTVPLMAGDGTVKFIFEVPGTCGAETSPAQAVLNSHRNSLSGYLQDAVYGGGANGDRAPIATCVSGALSLTRQL